MLNNAIFKIYEEACDLFLENKNIGFDAKLYFIDKKDCTNCNQNVYDGNIPFTNLCPFCEGKNYIEIETTEIIRVRYYNNPKNWIKISGVDFISGRAQIIFYSKDLDKITKSKKIEIDPASSQNLIYSLSTKCFPHGFGSKYSVAFIDSCSI